MNLLAKAGVTCDACGAPATHQIKDLHETEPVQDKDGQWWATWEPFGDLQAGCAEHPVEPAKHYKTGRTHVGELPIEVWNRGHMAAMAAQEVTKSVQR
jgi:hypothetical protein